MDDRRLDVADALSAAARELNTPRRLEDTLDILVRAAVDTVPGIDHAGISVTHRKGKIETMAATDPFVRELDNLQYELSEGPCLDAISGGSPIVVVEKARHDQRWPTYMPRAVHRGLRSQLGLQLYADDKSLGGLNLYSTSSDTIPAESRHIAELFATHAALALGRADVEGTLNEAILTRQVIGQAIGILMERYHITEARAFEFLVRTSQDSNIKLRHIAQELVDQGNGRAAT